MPLGICLRFCPHRPGWAAERMLTMVVIEIKLLQICCSRKELWVGRNCMQGSSKVKQLLSLFASLYVRYLCMCVGECQKISMHKYSLGLMVLKFLFAWHSMFCMSVRGCVFVQRKRKLGHLQHVTVNLSTWIHFLCNSAQSSVILWCLPCALEHSATNRNSIQLQLNCNSTAFIALPFRRATLLACLFTPKGVCACVCERNFRLITSCCCMQHLLYHRPAVDFQISPPTPSGTLHFHQCLPLRVVSALIWQSFNAAACHCMLDIVVGRLLLSLLLRSAVACMRWWCL